MGLPGLQYVAAPRNAKRPGHLDSKLKCLYAMARSNKVPSFTFDQTIEGSARDP